MEIIYYEDIVLNNKFSIGGHYVDKEEMLDFASKWDSLPFHIDEELAKSYPAGGLIAPASYTMAIITRLGAVSERPRTAVLAGLEFDDVKILKAVRPGDKLAVTKEHIHKRESRTRPDCGIVRTLMK